MSINILSDAFLEQYKGKNPFKNELGNFVYNRTYSRPLPEEGRREYWWETVRRVVEYNFSLEYKRTGNITPELIDEAQMVYDMMFNLKLFPSGRTLWVGGTKNSELYPLCNFNCSFMVIDSLHKYEEMLYLLMLGTGVGASVQKKYVNQLPLMCGLKVTHRSYDPVAKEERLQDTETYVTGEVYQILSINIGDSKGGWAKALGAFLDANTVDSPYREIVINYNNVRPRGERLKTFGGYASGPESLRIMFEKISEVLGRRQNGQLTPLDCLDISTCIAENVVSGGVRRSAEVILCDPDDADVISAKKDLWLEHGINKKIENRAYSNNTILYPERPSFETILDHVLTIRDNGEPGFGNYAVMLSRNPNAKGANPCFEIILDDQQVCNLTEVNVMAFVNQKGSLDVENLLYAQRCSARMGYRMASVDLELPQWNEKAKRDMLTGCSLTGVMDAINATNMDRGTLKYMLTALREIAREAVDEMAEQFGLNKSLLVTAIKPSGTVSQLPGVSSGMHYSYSPYFIRRVRSNWDDPITKAMIASGYPYRPENGQEDMAEPRTVVFEFPMKAPDGRTSKDQTVHEQLEMYKLFMECYVDHNASNTIYVKPHEWDEVAKWLYENWDTVVGVTFLPDDGGVYEQAPYEEITKEKYEEMVAKNYKLDVEMIKFFEDFQEHDLGSDCASGACPTR